MGYQVYKIRDGIWGSRWGGYGVPAVCEQPYCNEEIDRGVSFACGGEPFADEFSCDRYFCETHLIFTCFNDSGEVDEENGEVSKLVCERCNKGEEEFDAKPETREWIDHLFTDESWEEWRKENPEEVKKIKERIKYEKSNKHRKKTN